MKNLTKSRNRKATFFGAFLCGILLTSTASASWWWGETLYETCVKTCSGDCDMGGKCTEILQ